VFIERHVGWNREDRAKALEVIGIASEEDLVDSAIPPDLMMRTELSLPDPLDEAQVTDRLHELAAKNHLTVPMYGLGHFPTLTPAVIRRNVVENPSWYTAYTPYQAEISQGRLEVLMAFQTLVSDLMGLPVATASLLDEATAAGEAVALARRAVKTGDCVIVDARVYPATLDVVSTRCAALDLRVVVADDVESAVAEETPFAVVVAQFGALGHMRSVASLRSLADAVHAKGALVVATADLLAATVTPAPGQWGADVGVGSAQRLGTPLWYGGPAAGFIAVKSGLERQIPGRLVGESVDADSVPAYRLALQTREQHIRREKATSNICTAQVLVAVTAAFYAMWHGPQGLCRIANEVHAQASRFADEVEQAGYELVSDIFFDTVAIRTSRARVVAEQAHDRGVGVRAASDDVVCVTFGEGVPASAAAILVDVLVAQGDGLAQGKTATPKGPNASGASRLGDHTRASDFLTAPVFSAYHSETAMMRYMKALADRDYALDRGMIPLGSCTMKLNPAVAMEAITREGFASLHPHAPEADAQGYAELMDELGQWLLALTGYDALSFAPNAGSQGEFAGLLAITRYHRARGETRDICLLPASAHGTNAASAALAGLRVVNVGTGANGAIDQEDLAAKVGEYGTRIAAIMITYPSTHGVYEANIRQVAEVVHGVGGQVYVDGANFNALVGLVRLGDLGADASHLNLHKTFGMPHGGGGPGVGPIAVKSHLAGFLPSPSPEHAPDQGWVAGSPHGSAGLLPITYAYIAALGASGLKQATSDAVLGANYVSARLRGYFPTLYVGESGLVAHECILDLRDLTHDTGITVDDVAKRLIDYGFHAPTMSFPVPGTLMVEPTESESLTELNRFCDAMISIRAEMDKVASGQWDKADNPLVNAPHPARRLVGEWTHPYTRQEAVYPTGVIPGPLLGQGTDKYWPPVARVDNAYGDRHLRVRLADLAD
jgi:glycine dehydrogenase